jgi:putative Mg2+ transporter-C (MgtC) family protein
MDFDLSHIIIGKLLLASGLGGMIGFERALRHKAAGLRTNMFICMGSALFTIISVELDRRMKLGGDPARIAAQIIPGIGFIGAGAIIRERGSIVGLTTAATIFAIASVGMAVGVGMYFTAVFSAVLLVLGLSVVGWGEQKFIPRSKLMTFRVTTPNLEVAMAVSNETLAQLNVPMQNFQVFRIGSEFLMEFDVDVLPAQQQTLFEKLSSISSKCEAAPHQGGKE